MAEAKQKPQQQFAARSSWKGQITFGMVSVPVKVFGATTSRDLTLNQVSKVDGSRIRYKKVRESDGQEVAQEEIGKAYEYSDGQYVNIDEAEVAQFKKNMKGLRSLDIVEFVPESAIDPVMLEKAFYVAPEHEAANKAYALLREAMRSEKVVGVAKLILRDKEHMALIRVEGDQLRVHTLFWPDEVKVPSFEIQDSELTKDELKMAKMLVKNLKHDEFDGTQYTDEYRESMLGYIAAKASGEAPKMQDAPAETPAAADLMEALRASVAAIEAQAV